MIKMNAPEFNDNSKKIFNGGVAGSVKNCKLTIKKRGRDEAENVPPYKFIVTDENGGEINKGFFDPSERSQKAKNYFVKEFKYYANSIFKVQVEEEYDSYTALLNDLMRKFHEASSDNDVMVNVAVAYGTEDYPKRFLEIGGYWEIKRVEDGVPTLSPSALTERPMADDEEVKIGGGDAKEDAAEADEEW